MFRRGNSANMRYAYRHLDNVLIDRSEAAAAFTIR